jgi:hypothetical protein
MTIVIIGDINLSQVIMLPRFREVLSLDFIFCPASTMVAFSQYRTLLPPGTEYLVVGCLASLLSGVSLSDEVSLSKIKVVT